MRTQQKRIMALLDVDNTLIFGADPIIYNNNLIDALIENGIKDVYLFSSMSLKKQTVTERAELIIYLQLLGMEVHGVICASDLVWQKDKRLLKEFYQQVFLTKTDEEIFNLLEQEKFQSLAHFDDALPSQAFDSVVDGIEGWSNADAALYQNTASAIRRYVDHQEKSQYASQIQKTEKSYLYQLIVQTKPEWAGNIIFVDDADSNIEAVLGMHNKLNSESAVSHTLLTVLNRNEKKEVHNTTSFYQAIIEPFVELTFAVWNAFNSYSSGRQFTHSAEKNKVLNNLGEALECCKTTDDVARVKIQFSEPSNQLNIHRFSIWSTAKTRSALTLDKMIEEREKQLTLPNI